MTPTPNLTQASANPQRAHLTHIDFLRILAIFLVILNHGAFRIPTTGHGILGSWVIFFFNQLIKMAVPIFFMISGALLLARKESYGQLFWKRIPRFLGVIIFFWTLQWSADIFSNGVFPSPSQFLQSLYSSSLLVERVGAYVAWFLYAYLAMLLLLPLLRRLARSMRDRDYLYLFGLQLVIAALLPTFVCLLAGQEISSELCKYLPFTRPGHLPFGSGFWAVFMLMGYFLEHRIHPAILATHTGGGYSHLLRILVPLSLVCLLAGTAMMMYCRGHQQDWELCYTTVFLTCYIPLPCATLYLLARTFFTRVSIPSFLQKTLQLTAGGVLTVMLTENLFRAAFAPVATALRPICGFLLSSLLSCILTLCSGLLLGIFLKKLPFLRRIL